MSKTSMLPDMASKRVYITVECTQEYKDEYKRQLERKYNVPEEAAKRLMAADVRAILDQEYPSLAALRDKQAEQGD